MKKVITIIFVILIITFISIFIYQKYLSNKTSLSINDFDYKNATYNIDNKFITLKNGISEIPLDSNSKSKIITKYFGNEVIGDFNNDGKSDIAFILTQETGGSGVFYYVAIALYGNHGYEGTNAIFLGDRIAPQTTEVRDGKLIVNYADRKSDEAMTASPSIGVSRYFIVKENKLIEITDQKDNSILYKNNDYGFSISLPIEWKGYSIIENTWKGNSLITSKEAPSGPKILIRNPKWTKSAPYEDIPILVFNISDWNAYLAEAFSISAAPILASELGRNNKYVFVLPPRWDFDYSLGYKEAQDIVAKKSFSAFNIGK